MVIVRDPSDGVEVPGRGACMVVIARAECVDVDYEDMVANSQRSMEDGVASLVVDARPGGRSLLHPSI